MHRHVARARTVGEEEGARALEPSLAHVAQGPDARDGAEATREMRGPFPNMSVHSATKGAVLTLTRSWAQELTADRVRVNAVSPGPTVRATVSDPKRSHPARRLLRKVTAASLQILV
jgi:NAD(P)-dependent dehydrogenase (short-subunit alcohol dehydrogenase family)